MPKAKRIKLLDFRTTSMRTFHITWITFFACFFGWFGIAPLMPVVREDLGLTRAQIGNIIIASVAITIFARLLIGWMCDRIGPRITYTVLLILGSLPVMLIGLSDSYGSFLLFRLAIGVIGASFVVTQYHTSVMFAPNVVGTANATAAGWGNMGGGVTLMIMPMIFAAFVGLGYTDEQAWRYSMVIPGIALLGMGVIYYFFTKDTPDGNLSEIKREKSRETSETPEKKTSFISACKDYRAGTLFLAFAACCGVENTIHHRGTLYCVGRRRLRLEEGSIIAGLFGLVHLFARALGGIFGDKAGKRYGLRGRFTRRGILLPLERLGLMRFTSM